MRHPESQYPVNRRIALGVMPLALVLLFGSNHNAQATDEISCLQSPLTSESQSGVHTYIVTLQNASQSQFPSDARVLDKLDIAIIEGTENDMRKLCQDDNVEAIEPDAPMIPVPVIPSEGTRFEAQSQTSNSFEGEDTTMALVDMANILEPDANVIEEFCVASDDPDVYPCPDGSLFQIGEGAAAPLPGMKHEHGQMMAETFHKKSKKVIGRYLSEDKKTGEPRGTFSDLYTALNVVADISEDLVSYGKDPVDGVAISSGEGHYVDPSSCNTGAMEQASKRLQENGTLIVASAGNGGAEGTAYVACHPDVMAVTASELESDGTLSIAEYANVSDKVKIATDGDIMFKGNRYYGTSPSAVRGAEMVGYAHRFYPETRNFTPPQMENFLRGRGLVLKTQRNGNWYEPAAVLQTFNRIFAPRLQK